MNLSDLPGFLVGNRACIERLARSRVPLVIGPFLVLSASLARNYDGAALPQEWTMLTHGIGASVVNAFLLFGIMRVTSVFVIPKPPFWRAFASFLGLFWLTAPMALVYAIPYERFLEPAEAIRANLWTLAAISVWRVLLIARVLSVLSGVRIWCPLFLTLFYSDLIVFVAAALMKAPLVNVMGGLQHAPPDEAILASAKFATSIYSVLAFGPLLVAACIATYLFHPVWISIDSRGASHKPSGSVWTFTAIMLAIWIGPLCVTQSEQHLRYQVDTLIVKGRIDEAFRRLDAHERNEFPPIWDPEPRLAYSGDHDQMIMRMAQSFTAQPPTQKWVRELAFSKLLRYVKRSGWIYDFDQYVQDAENSPAKFQERVRPAVAPSIRVLLAHDESLSESDRSNLDRLLKVIETPPKAETDSPK